MNIIIEGPDASGKSTLAKCLADHLGWDILSSEGPTRSEAEFRVRALRFLACDRVIFDRHCIVSEQIYGAMRGDIMTPPELQQQFHTSSKLIVYCRSSYPSLEGHVAKAHDTPDHLALIAAKQLQIHQLYDDWALGNANILYRKGESPGRIVRFIMGETGL